MYCRGGYPLAGHFSGAPMGIFRLPHCSARRFGGPVHGLRPREACGCICHRGSIEPRRPHQGSHAIVCPAQSGYDSRMTSRVSIFAIGAVSCRTGSRLMGQADPGFPGSDDPLALSQLTFICARRAVKSRARTFLGCIGRDAASAAHIAIDRLARTS